MKNNKLFQAIKIAFAAVLAILAANLLGLKYAVTAGIITVLSIQNTKRETFNTALHRGLAFICALIISFICYGILGFSVAAFALYLFIFAFVCLNAKWPEAIAMDSVLISHFLAEQTYDIGILINETALFIIGTGFGILINLHLKKRTSEFDELSNNVDEEIKGIIHRMSVNLRNEDKSGYNSECFARLEAMISKAKECAVTNRNNTLWNQSMYELDYVRMRENQSRVLKNIYQSIVMINNLPAQTIKVAGFFEEIERQYNRENDVSKLIEMLDNMMTDMREENLPLTREEFEARAVLFYILKQLDELLQLKYAFAVRYIK